ncbi:MAG: hypothetical protein ABI692_03345 [Terracoccus sp.]
MRLRRVAAGVMTASVLTLAAGCSTGDGGATPSPSNGSLGGSDAAATGGTGALDTGSPAAIFAAALAHAEAATSGAFTGTIDDQGEQAKVSFKGTRDGSAVDVTKAAPKAGRVHLISLGGTVYVKADKTFWNQQSVPFLVSLFGDQFVKVPAGVVPVLDQLTLKAFVDKSIGTYSASDLPGPVTEANVNGIGCWVLTTTSGKPADGALYVSKGAADVVRWIGTPQQPGRLDFSRWNQKLGVTAPPADQVFSIG